MIDHPNATPHHHQLAMRLRGTTDGLTRRQIADTLGVSDRAARQLVEDLTAWGALAILCDRGESGREEGRYRVATASEVERVNRELNELSSRGLSALRRAKGLRTAYQQAHQAGSLFLADVPVVPDLEATP